LLSEEVLTNGTETSVGLCVVEAGGAAGSNTQHVDGIVDLRYVGTVWDALSGGGEVETCGASAFD
jgi:hypothetical protein